MKTRLVPVCVGLLLLVVSTTASAAPIDIGGLEVAVGNVFSVSQVYENVPTGIGDVLAGYGKVDSINSIAVGSLCTGCELTYSFGGYQVSSVSPTEIKFTGGWYKFYLGFGADNDFTTGNAGGSAGDLVEATNGTLFLTLKGHAIDAAGNTFVGTGAGIGTIVPTGFGTGLADVDTSAGGIANPNFDANSIVALFGGPADFELGSSFSGLHPVYPSECPGGAACLRGSGDMTGNAQESGGNEDPNTPVPEPSTLLLCSAGLGAVAAGRKRRG